MQDFEHHVATMPAIHFFLSLKFFYLDMEANGLIFQEN